MKSLVFCLLGLACAQPALGAIYVQRDASGAMVYSNVPPPERASQAAPAVARPAPVTTVTPAATAQRASFPVIARAEQQQRDADRHAILRTELDDEQQRLDRAQAARAPADVQQRHRGNVAALKREIATLR